MLSRLRVPFAAEWSGPDRPLPPSGGDAGVTLFNGILPIWWERYRELNLGNTITWLGAGTAALVSVSTMGRAGWKQQNNVPSSGFFFSHRNTSVPAGFRYNVSTNPGLLATWNPGFVLRSATPGFLEASPPGDVVCSVVRDARDTSSVYFHFASFVSDAVRNTLDGFWQTQTGGTLRPSWGDSDEPFIRGSIFSTTTAPVQASPATGTSRAALDGEAEIQVFRQFFNGAYTNDLLVKIPGEVISDQWPDSAYPFLARPSTYRPPTGTPGMYALVTP